ncbi:MAG: SH3 domain-containing protein [Clostridiales bacterium]|nr:SH3 domain-containing protein [Clostridiales bacterium]
MKRIISLVLSLFCFALCINVGMAETSSTSTLALIDAGNASKVHLRAEPSTAAASLGLYFTGTGLVCYSDPTQEWVKVAIGAERGYIKSEYLRWGTGVLSVQTQQPIGVIHTKGVVNVRATPSTQGEQGRTLNDNDAVTIMGETATHWYYIHGDDFTGYVMTEYITMEESSGAPIPAEAQDEASLYNLVLHNELEFFNVSENSSMYLGKLNSGYDGLPLTFPAFATVDLDADGSVEVIVSLRADGNEYDYGYEIFDYLNGRIYGFDIPYRGFGDLKLDGSFSFSSGASDSGYGTLELNQNGYTIKPIVYCESASSGGTNYYSNGAAISETSYSQLIAQQAKKANAIWYDIAELTDRNDAERYFRP